MITTFIKEIFRPYQNRYYVGYKRHAKMYVIGLIPLTALLVYVLMNNLSVSSLKLATVVAGLLLTDYFVVDKHLDKFLWEKAYKRFYGEQPNPDPELHQAMKALEKDPNEVNRQRVAQLIKSQK